jgi:fucokinase
MTKQFPFDCVIVTSPDEASAQSLNGPLHILKRRVLDKYPSQAIQLISTCDPFGARCGSGGGTIAALEYASSDQSVLILHAGGDSSRCPTQMILGKAWTNLPNAKYRNPTIWLIDQLILLWEVAKFPKGTLIVAATDCLLRFFDNHGLDPVNEWKCPAFTSKSVIGVAVPAPVSTAKNHGVYILPESVLKRASDKLSPLVLEDPLDVWQKPSIEILATTTEPAPASFQLPLQKEKQAWIDTGLIVFLPAAFQTLYDLSNGILARCTRKGLIQLYKTDKKRKFDQVSLKEFARDNALKIDLYTDILHNLSWSGQSIPQEQSPLQQELSQIRLSILCAPEGAFLHLGTSIELLKFLTSEFRQNLDKNNQMPVDSAVFSVLKPKLQAWRAPRSNHNVVLQSTFSESTQIGENTFIEYSDLAVYTSVSIGSRCILSGWRNPMQNTSPLVIPSDLCVQFLSLKDDSDSFIFMVLGIGDPIKTQRQDATFLGLSAEAFQTKICISLDQLGWNKQDTLWTAKLHPKVPSGTSFKSVYGWITELDGDISQNASLRKWLSLPRVSLKELHCLASANTEWRFRHELETRIVQLQQTDSIPNLCTLLRQRRLDKPCNFQWLLEIEDSDLAEKELRNILVTLEDIVLEELKQDRE